MSQCPAVFFFSEDHDLVCGFSVCLSCIPCCCFCEHWSFIALGHLGVLIFSPNRNCSGCCRLGVFLRFAFHSAEAAPPCTAMQDRAGSYVLPGLAVFGAHVSPLINTLLPSAVSQCNSQCNIGGPERSDSMGEVRSVPTWSGPISFLSETLGVNLLHFSVACCHSVIAHNQCSLLTAR